VARLRHPPGVRWMACWRLSARIPTTRAAGVILAYGTHGPDAHARQQLQRHLPRCVRHTSSKQVYLGGFLGLGYAKLLEIAPNSLQIHLKQHSSHMPSKCDQCCNAEHTPFKYPCSEESYRRRCLMCAPNVQWPLRARVEVVSPGTVSRYCRLMIVNRRKTAASNGSRQARAARPSLIATASRATRTKKIFLAPEHERSTVLARF
jgi:hypothetical protein